MAKKEKTTGAFETNSREDKIIIILEDMRDEIKIIAEGHTVLVQGQLKLGKELNEFKKDTANNFKLAFDYLSRKDFALGILRDK